MKILIIEDNNELVATLQMFLESQGFTIDSLGDGSAAERRILLHHKDYDLIVLDWMLPGKEGVEILKTIRAHNIETPVLMLTAKDAITDRVIGLEQGADDYLIKPFVPAELSVRIKALLRRPAHVLPMVICVGDIVLDQATRKVLKDGKEISLTFKEFALIEYLMRNQGRALEREEIFTHVWDFASNAMSNVIDVHMYFLRKKLGGNGAHRIETVPGVGYRLAPIEV